MNNNDTITITNSFVGISIGVGDVITTPDSGAYRVVSMTQTELDIVPFPPVPLQKLRNIVYRITGEQMT